MLLLVAKLHLQHSFAFPPTTFYHFPIFLTLWCSAFRLVVVLPTNLLVSSIWNHLSGQMYYKYLLQLIAETPVCRVYVRVVCSSRWGFAFKPTTRKRTRTHVIRPLCGVQVNAVCPSTTDTPMVDRFSAKWPDWQAKQNASFPVGRIARAEEIAATVVFLLSTDCPMMTGTCLTVDGAASA